MKHWNTHHSKWRYWHSMRGRRCSMQRHRQSAIALSYRRYRRGVSGDIGDCRVGITPQMCNRVTNHGDVSTFFKPAKGDPESIFPLWQPGVATANRTEEGGVLELGWDLPVSKTPVFQTPAAASRELLTIEKITLKSQMKATASTQVLCIEHSPKAFSIEHSPSILPINYLNTFDRALRCIKNGC